MTAGQSFFARHRRLIAIVAAVALLAGLGAKWWIAREEAANRVVYKPAKIARVPILSTVLATGSVAPENRLEIKTPVAGRVEKVLVDEGVQVRKSQVLGWMSSTERAALLDAAASKGADEVKRWEELYRPTPILAPLNGRLIARNVESGQTVTTSDAVFVMSDRLIVKAQADETDLALIKLGSRATIVLDAYPLEKIPAKVAQIAYDAKTVNNVTTYAIDVLPETTPEAMRSGMTANVTFTIAERPDALAVPTEAIFTKQGKFYLRVGTEDAFEEREVGVGITDGKRTEILSGAAENESALIAQLPAKGRGGGQNSNPLNPMGRGPGTGTRKPSGGRP